MSARELLPCPFCGGTDLKSGGDDKIVGTWCLTCEASGPNEYGKFAWSRRVAPPGSRVVPEGAVDAAIDAFQQIIKIDRAFIGTMVEVAPGVGGRSAQDRDGPSAAIARAALRALAETKP